MTIVAIDVHTHISDPRARSLQGPDAQRRFTEKAKHFGVAPQGVTIDQQAAGYRDLKMMAVLMNGTDESITGRTPLPNDFVAEAVQSHPDVFMGMGAIDPWQGELARREIVRIKELGLVGIGELNPARQHFYPNDPRFYPLWETAQELGLVVLFHGGFPASGSGTRGGSGVKLKYAQPIHLDDVAADFPDLNIICAHPAWPWTSETLAIARHKPNYFIDLSGWAPKYFSKELLNYANSVIPDKVLFGSDAPLLPLKRWLAEFEELPIKDESRKKIMLKNAQSLFKVADR